MQFLVLSRVRPGVIGIAVVLLLCLAVSPAAADDGWVTLQTWDFESGTTDGWWISTVYGQGPYMSFSLTPSATAYNGNYSLQCSVVEYSVFMYATVTEPVDADEYRLEYWSRSDSSFSSTVYGGGVGANDPDGNLIAKISGSGAWYSAYSDTLGSSLAATSFKTWSHHVIEWSSITGVINHSVYSTAGDLLGSRTLTRGDSVGKTPATVFSSCYAVYPSTPYYGYSVTSWLDDISLSARGFDPTADFTVSLSSGPAPLTVQFTDTSTRTPITWHWDFGDGATSTQQHPTHTYTGPGTYTVTLTATNAYGSDTKTMTDLITVYESGPYYIRTYADLCKVGTGADGWTLDADYIQTADIQCPAGSNFPRIGLSPGTPFTGTYDGNGYEIRDLLLNYSDFHTGMFIVIGETGIVQNVTLVDVDVSSTSSRTGALAGLVLGTVRNCHSSGTVAGADLTGGLIGVLGEYMGTDVGYLESSSSSCTVTQTGLYSTGQGGLVGSMLSGSMVECSATGDVIDGFIAGGLIGIAEGGTISVSRCSAAGNVTAPDGCWSGTGGLIGKMSGSVSVTDCYAAGGVSAPSLVGGLIGNRVGGTISSCYATGQVAATDEYGTAGGLIGGGGGTSSSFWDTETSGQATSDGGVGKTTAQMQALATFADWSIATPAEYTDEVWYIVPGEDYPRLAWEGLPTPEEPTPTPTATSGTLPGPTAVRFVVQTYAGQALENVTVTATPLESTGPWAWLYDLFGISGDADLTGTALTGTTDSGGGIVLPLIKTVKYRVAVTDLSRGIDTAITIYPQEDAVVLTVWPQEPPGPANDFQLYAGEEGRDIRVGVRYATSDLTRITFTVTTEAGDVLARKVSTDQAGDLTYVIDGRPGEVYLYGYVAEHKTAGVLRQDQYVRFAGEDRPWVDFADWIPMYAYQWSAIAILVGFGTTFMRGEIRGGMLTIPIIAGILQVIGWLQIPWIIVGVALVIGVLVYARMSESDLGI